MPAVGLARGPRAGCGRGPEDARGRARAPTAIWQAAGVDRIALGSFHALVTGEGRPVVYLHGFPDHPPTAAAFCEALARRGHRVLAPWLRGYAPSPAAGPFDLATLAADVRALIERWSPDRPVDVVGHDWGAAITYALCAAAPARVARAVTLALPHPLTFLRRLRSPAQLARSWYMLLFQLPGAGHLAAARDLALIDRLWRAWSPGFALAPAARARAPRVPRRELAGAARLLPRAAAHAAPPRPADCHAAAPAARRARRLRAAARRPTTRTGSPGRARTRSCPGSGTSSTSNSPRRSPAGSRPGSRPDGSSRGSTRQITYVRRRHRDGVRWSRNPLAVETM